MKKLFLCFAILLSIPVATMANTPFYVGIGNMTQNFLSAQSSPTGAVKKFEFGPTVLLGASFPFLFSDFYLNPAIGFTKFSTKDNSSKSQLLIQYHANQSLFSGFHLLYGFSNYISTISGDGSSVVLNNGNSTATFYAPKESKKSYTASLDVGGEVIIDSTWTARLEFSIMRFLSSDRRRVNNLLTANYYF